MAGQGQEDSALTPLQRALIAVRELKAKIARLDTGPREPIAIVGLACRFPGGGDGAEGLWSVLSEGRDVTGDVPPERWEASAWDHLDLPRRGAFLDGIDRFDAAFFGIAPREAVEMDPSQRLLLEVSWQALEDAGIPPTSLEGSATAVMLGLGLSDYGRRHFLGSDPARLTAWSGTGSMLSVAAGRIAYALGLQGPALTVDTACSSSLVATHLAMGALRTGECDVALAAGANLLLSPIPTAYFQRLGALAADGRCKTFSAAADGYGRGEGVVVVVLKRLSDALAAGDRIRAVLRGSAVNQDGRSNGLTAPSGRAQQAVIRAALADAGLSPSDVGAIEAHGTGTPLGDPIEVDALRAVFEGQALAIGSVKTNLGHTESAAGLAGLAKAVLALEHRQLPAHLHLDALNPRIELGAFTIPSDLEPWPEERPLRMGVSAFGLSGTNAHVIVEAAPDRVEVAPPSGPHLLVLSARSDLALRVLTTQMVERLSRPDACIGAVAQAAWFARSHLSWRLSVVAETNAEATKQLSQALPRQADRGKVAWLFTGQGSQWPGMAADLYRECATFRSVIDRVGSVVEGLVQPWLAGHGQIGDTEWTQPALYALQCGLAAHYSEQGLEPAALLGHSIGEFAAAQVAGVFSLEQGAKLVAARGRLMGALPPGGAMVAVFSADLPTLPDGVELAARNHPGECVVSGTEAGVVELEAELAELGVQSRRLEVSHAFHSRRMEPMMQAFSTCFEGVELNAPRRRLVSSVDGEVLGVRAQDPAYWVEQIRRPVLFSDALLRLADCGVFLELGPHPILCAAGARTLPDARFVPSLTRDAADERAVLRSLGELWSSGVPLRRARRKVAPVALPPTPFQRERFWLAPQRVAGGLRSDAVLRVRWDVEEVAGAVASPSGTWWVFAHGPSDVELALLAKGCEVVRVMPGARFEVGPHGVVVDPEQPAHFEQLLEHAGVPSAVLILWGISEGVRSREGLLGALFASRTAGARVSVVVPSDRASGLPGLFRVLRSEHPERMGSLIHVDDGVPPVEVLSEVARRSPEVWLGSERRVPHLCRAQLAEAPPLGGTVWLTGASGDLGIQLARRLAKEVDALVLISRRGTPPDELTRLGAHVRSVKGDVTDNLVPLAAEAPPDLIFHLAGARVDGASDRLDAGDLERALHAKVDGAWRLNEVAPDAELVLVGSAASRLGNPGQAAYAAANAWLEGFARWRSEQGAPTICVAPGPVSGTAMTAGLLDRFEAMGARPLAPGELIDMVLAARGSAEPLVVLAPFDWDLWSSAVPGPHLDVLATPRSLETVRPAVSVRGVVAEAVRSVLGLDEVPSTSLGFFDAGMDSVMALELRTRLQDVLGRSLAASVVFDHPTITALTAHLVGESSVPAPALSVDPAEPIAVIGIGCRLPGAGEGPEAFWDFLRAGGEATAPLDRWDTDRWYDPTPATPGRHYIRDAALLHDIAGFDAARFGIAPREAERLDPQQRLLLEASWSALEDAGRAPLDQGGSRTGVFVGIARSEYAARFDALDPAAGPDPHSGTGNEASFAAGRIAYSLGLRGPALAIDTACSSSLVALHLAVRSLRSGECDQALAGGVHALVDPETTIQLSQIRALAPDGRCKTFDAAADGYGRGEGVGVVALVRLSDALARGDRIWGVIRGTAVGHDGASAGLTVPNGTAQREVLRAALDDAQVQPEQIGLLETHGTGTRLGDPIEVGAIGAVYGSSRERPLMLGAVKANIGHLEAAAGIAGVIKACLCLHHSEVPPHPTLGTVNPELDLTGMSIPTEVRPLTSRWAAVSSFGISGTNAHVVIQHAPDPVYVAPEPRSRILLVGSPNEAAPAATPGAALALGSHRSVVGPRQIAVIGGSDVSWFPVEGPTDGGLAWLFTGQGAQWKGMGRDLEAAEPVFAKAMEGCRGVLAELGIDLDAVRSDDRLNDTRFTQPVGFAVGWSLAVWLRSRGVTPDRVMGHSLGEWVAAAVAGVLDWEQALRLVALRGALMAELPRGSSVAVFCDVETARAGLRDDPVDIAGLNGAVETVISGARADLEAVVQRLGVEHHWLNVSHAFHSRMMDPALAPFAEAVSKVELQLPTLPLITNADGTEVGERALDPAHWASLIRRPVVFDAGLKALAQAGASVFLEVGPHPVLCGMAARVTSGRFIPTLRRGADGPDAMYRALGDLWGAGVQMDWRAITGVSRADRLGPPPFRRVRHWVERTPIDPGLPPDWFYGVEWVRRSADSQAVPSDVRVFDGRLRDALASAQRVVTEGGRWAAVVPMSPEGSAVAGFARSFALEHAESFFGVVHAGADEPLTLAQERLGTLGDEQEIAGPERSVRRLVRRAALPGLQTSGAVLVTGGTGTLGRAVVRQLQALGMEVVVAARRDAQVADARVVQVDMGDADAVATADFGPIRGVVHCAGVGRRVALLDEDGAGVDAVFAGKVQGARALDVRFPDLDFFVGVSSIAATWGSAGQTLYAAANAALEALVRARRARGQVARTVALGPLHGGLTDAKGARWLSERGVRTLPVDAAARAVLCADGVVADIDWSRFGPLLTARGPKPLIEQVYQASVSPSGGQALDRRRLEQVVRARVAAVLGLEADQLDPEQGFFDAGMDSLTAVELASGLGSELGRSIPATLAFEHSSIHAVVDHLVGAAPVPVKVVSTRGAEVVIVGMGCRFPGGVRSPESFWELLCSGRDAVGPVPRDRWDSDALYAPEPGTPGRSYVRAAAFIDAVDQFDPLFFGLSPREADALDPAQRLLLEVSWQALERGGLADSALRGSRVGVFCGIPESSYLHRFQTSGAPMYMDEYAGTGNESSFAAGRVAYALGLRGPAVSLNTACSSSLVALHLAAESLRSGDCDAALAGGVSLMLSPENHLYLSRLGALAPDGRCKTFDAAADGYGRGEGAGMVALMRRADAETRGVPILASVLGSAVNHDGASGGLTVPNGQAQEEVVRQALERSGLDPSEIGFVEAHGTGTRLGDPIEIRALQRAFGERSRPLHVASVKTVLGHLEQASGAAALIKVVLQQLHGEITPHLHLSTLNPEIELGPLVVPTRKIRWQGARNAGVSGFGLSGTNAHVILGPAPPRQPVAVEGVELLLGSATSPEALVDLWTGVAASLESDRAVAVAGALGARRGHPVRQWRLGDAEGAVRTARLSPSVGLLFTGQGAQHLEMGRELAATEPVFRDAVQEVVELARPHLGFDLWEAMATDQVHHTAVTQPALFAFEWGVATLLRELGIEASAVAGHSVGEVVAAAWAGMLSLPDAVAFVCARGRLMGELPSGGAMAAVFAAESVVRDRLVPGAEIAAVNHVDEIVITGEEQAVQSVLASLPEGVAHRRLAVSHAFHSARMDPVLGPLTELVAGIQWQSPRIPVARNVDGGLHELPPEVGYWAKQLRQGVRFADGVRALTSHGITSWVEVGPHPVLVGSVLRAQPSVVAVGVCHRTRDAEITLLEAAGALWSDGVAVNLSPRFALPGLTLPPTPFSAHRCWLDLPEYVGVALDPASWMLTLDWQPSSPGPGDLDRRVIEIGGAEDFAALERALEQLLREAQSLAAAREAVVFVTRGAPLLSGEQQYPLLRAVHGFVRSAAAEGLDWAVVDADLGADESAIRAAVADGERWAALRDGVRFVPRLDTVRGVEPPSIRSDHAYLVTGGSGDLGAAVAGALLEAGAGQVWLLSRTVDAEVVATLGERAHGVSCDLREPGSLANVVASISLPIAGAIHAAGVVKDAALASQTQADFQAVMGAKVQGALALQEALARAPLDFLVLFGSASATMGSAGQSPYAAANAALVGLSMAWRAEGVPATCISWGPWQAGMAGRLSPRVQASQAARGIRSLPVDGGIAAFMQLIGGPRAETLVLDVDWEQLVIGSPDPLLERLAAPPPVEAAPIPSERERIAASVDRRADLEELVERVVRPVLRLATDQALDRGQALQELGMDSLMAVTLRSALADRGFDLPIARLIGGPSVEEIAAMGLATLADPTPVSTAAEGSPDELIFHPAVTHLLVALLALVVGGVAVWTASRILGAEPPAEPIELRAPRVR